MSNGPLSQRFSEAREIGRWEGMGGAALALLGIILVITGTPSIVHGAIGTESNQYITALGLIMIPLGASVIIVGSSRRREALRRVLFFEALASNLRPETLAYVQANSQLGIGDIAIPEPASLRETKQPDFVVKMEILKSLLEKGLISEKDYSEKKDELLARL